MFASALGYDLSNANELLAQLRSGVQRTVATPGKSDAFGHRFTIDIQASGPKGAAVVRTGWIFKNGSHVPELTTLFVKQEQSMRVFDTVRLLTDKPEHGLLAGAVGVIVEEHAVPLLAFEVEFCNDDGETLVVAAIEPDALEPMPVMPPKVPERG